MVVCPLRRRYLRDPEAAGPLPAACGVGHADPATAVHDVLGADPAGVLARWQQWWPASLTQVSRVLLVTNDFPPRRGGIQSYLGEFVRRLVAAGSHA